MQKFVFYEVFLLNIFLLGTLMYEFVNGTRSNFIFEVNMLETNFDFLCK